MFLKMLASTKMFQFNLDGAAVLYSCSFETDFETCSIKNYGRMKWKKDSVSINVLSLTAEYEFYG
jgi:hypothetical protein